MGKCFNKSAMIMVLIFLVSFSSCLKDTPTGEKVYGGRAGQYIPPFELSDNEGYLFNQDDLIGKTVLIEFWASWCSYCNAEADDLKLLYTDYKDKGFDIVGVSIDTDASAWIKKISDHNIEYTQLIDTDGFNSSFAQACEVSSIPKMLLIDSEGRILLVSSKTSEVRAYLQQNNY